MPTRRSLYSALLFLHALPSIPFVPSVLSIPFLLFYAKDNAAASSASIYYNSETGTAAAEATTPIFSPRFSFTVFPDGILPRSMAEPDYTFVKPVL